MCGYAAAYSGGSGGKSIVGSGDVLMLNNNCHGDPSALIYAKVVTCVMTAECL